MFTKPAFVFASSPFAAVFAFAQTPVLDAHFPERVAVRMQDFVPKAYGRLLEKNGLKK